VPIWSPLELYVVPPHCSGASPGVRSLPCAHGSRAATSLSVGCARRAGATDARNTRVPRPPRARRIGASGASRRGQRQGPQQFTVLSECLLNTDCLRAHLRQWASNETSAACSALEIDETALNRVPLSRNCNENGLWAPLRCLQKMSTSSDERAMARRPSAPLARMTSRNGQSRISSTALRLGLSSRTPLAQSLVSSRLSKRASWSSAIHRDAQVRELRKARDLPPKRGPRRRIA
jgi:hypothetical protein